MLLLKTWTVLLTFQQNLQTVDFISPNNANKSALAVFMFFIRAKIATSVLRKWLNYTVIVLISNSSDTQGGCSQIIIIIYVWKS